MSDFRVTSGSASIEQALSAARDLEAAIGEVVNYGRNPWKLPMSAMAVLIQFARNTASQPAVPTAQTRSQRLREAGYTARDPRLQCDECGKAFTPQMLPIHKCQPTAQAREPLSDERINAMWSDNWDGFVSLEEATVIVRETERALGIGTDKPPAALPTAHGEHQAGCRRSLADGQWWAFCGETDMGQTTPALCTECGGTYKLRIGTDKPTGGA